MEDGDNYRCCMLHKTGFVSISPTVAEWQATQNCVTDRHKIFPLTAIAPILNGGWGQYYYNIKVVQLSLYSKITH